MRFLYMAGALLAGALVGWLSVIAGLWFIMPVFLICAAIVSISLDRVFRWRLAAFSIGMLAVFALELGSFVNMISEGEAQYKAGERRQKEREKKQKSVATPPTSAN